MTDDTTLNLGSGGDVIASDDISGVKHQKVLLEFGPDGTATRVARAEPLPVDDPFLDIAKGNNDGFIHKFGRNQDVDSAAAEDVWDGGALWVPPTTARLHDVVSTSTDDDGSPAGIGAQTIQVFGLDSSFNEQDETLTLNGMTDVPTVNAYTMIHRMVILAAGSTGSNVGTITATAQTDATVTAQITINKNQTFMAIYQVPAGKAGYLVQMHGSIVGTVVGKAAIELFATPDGEVLQGKFSFGLNVAGSSFADPQFRIPIAFAAKTILRMRAFSDTNDLDVTAGFDLVLV